MTDTAKGWQAISGELSGSLGDLGVLLPFAIGFVTIAGYDPASILFSFGLLYIIAALVFRAPVPIQPMKVVGAAVLVGQLGKNEAALAGLIMGAVLIILALSGLIERLSNLIPMEINMGVVAGLGISLAVLGLKHVNSELWLGIAGMVLAFFLLASKKLPAALLVLVAGTLAGILVNPPSMWPQLIPGIYLPGLQFPFPAELKQALLVGFLPQFPQTLTNSVIVTAALALQLYPEQADRISERRLLISLGAGNLLVPFIGGFPYCHGSGGMAAHYRFGGRTMFTPLIIGGILFLMSILLGPGAIAIMALIPPAILGSLLFYSGVELLLSARKAFVGSRSGFFFISVTAILSLAYNAGVGFFVGLGLYYLMKRIDPFEDGSGKSHQ